MTDFKEGDKVHFVTEVTAVHPDWLAVRLTFGRSVQNIRVSREDVVLAEEPAKASKPAKKA